jgi:hypothetical protein
MIPLLAPLLGSLAGSLLPATVGTGIAGALGLKGAAAGLIAAAAPKAIGAGIGTLLAGGNLGDAALNAVGFGAAGAAGSALSGGLSGTPGVGAAAPALGGAAPAAAVPPTVPTDAAASALDMQGLSRSAQQIAQALGGGQQQAAPQMMQAPTTQGQPRSRASDNPMLASMFEPPASPALASAPSSTIPSVGGSSMMPPAVGIGTIPMGGQQPMSNDMMLAGMSPNQSSMVNQYLRSRNMVGFV